MYVFSRAQYSNGSGNALTLDFDAYNAPLQKWVNLSTASRGNARSGIQYSQVTSHKSYSQTGQWKYRWHLYNAAKTIDQTYEFTLGG